MKPFRLVFWMSLAAVCLIALPAFARESTNTPTPAAPIQTYTTPEGSAQVSFPADFVFKERSNSDSVLSIKIGNSEAALEKDLFDQDYIFDSGEVHVEVDVMLLSKLAEIMPAGTLTADSTPMDIIDAIAQQGMPDTFTFDKPGTTTIAGNPTVRMNLTAQKRGEGQLLVTILNKKWVVGLILYAAAGEGDKWDMLARDLVTSVKLELPAPPTPTTTGEPPALTQTIKSENGGMSVMYPDKWVARQSSDKGVYIANTADALNYSFGSKLNAGEVNILVSAGSIADFSDESKVPLKADASPYEILQLVVPVVGSSVKFGEIGETSVNDKRAARVDFQGQGFEGTAWLIESHKGTLVAVQLLTAPGESPQWRKTALAIAASVRSRDE